MRYVKIPVAVRVKNAVNQVTGEPVDLSLADLIEFILGTNPLWRQDDVWMSAFLEITDALRAAKDGEIVPIEDSHVEKILQVFKQADLRAEMNTASIRVMRSITNASKTPPDGFVAATEPSKLPLGPSTN